MKILVDENIAAVIWVGPKTAPDVEKTVFEVKKSLIISESDYFRRLYIDEPHKNEFVVNYDPDIFGIALEFIKRKELGNVDLDTLFSLAAAAEQFGMDGLKKECVKTMASVVSMKTVWQIYDTNYEAVIENCEWLLKTRTQVLLTRPEFLEIKPETLARFLELDEMNIESESVLVEACIQFADSKDKKHKSDKDVFREYALPHLRLLTLAMNDIMALQFCLTGKETLFLIYHMGLSVFPAPKVAGLCLDERQRRPENARILVVEPDKAMYDFADLFWEGSQPENPAQNNKFFLSFEMKKRVLMQRIDFFCPIITNTHLYMSTCKTAGGVRVPQDVVQSKLTISTKGQEGVQVDVLTPQPRDMFLNRTASIVLNVEVPESARVLIEIEFSGLWYFHKFSKSEATIFGCSDPSVQEVLGNVTLKHLHDGEEREEELNTTVFKTVHMKLM